MVDLILHRYGTLEYVKSLDVEDALNFIGCAYRKQEEERLWQRWIMGYQFEMSFDEFKLKLTPVKLKKDEDIIEDVYGIISMANGGERT